MQAGRGYEVSVRLIMCMASRVASVPSDSFRCDVSGTRSRPPNPLPDTIGANVYADSHSRQINKTSVTEGDIGEKSFSSSRTRDLTTILRISSLPIARIKES
eukprot:1367428-Amorphochlora_amoeboformis.AAC.1